MHRIDTIPGRTVMIDGSEYLYFSGTSYLGISKNPEFSALLLEGLKKYGNNYSSSRISNLQLKIFEEAEYYLSNLVGSEAALTMSSGYMAGQVVVQMLANGDAVNFIYAPNSHPALWRTPADFFVEDFQTWTKGLKEKIKSYSTGKFVILCNAIDPLFAKKYDFEWINELPKDRDFVVVVDDSHGLGIIGKGGSGIWSAISVPDHVRLIVLSSLGKALGIPGGVILSSKAVVEEIKRSAFFGGSSPAIPAYLFAFLKAEEIYKKARMKLLKNVECFSRALLDLEAFRFLADYPVFYVKNNSLATKLLQQKILISSFPYPTSDDELVTRIIVNSLHTGADIEKLLAAIKKLYEYKI